MEKFIKVILLTIFLVLVLTGCSHKINYTTLKKADDLTVSEITAKEEDSMNREFCKVEEILKETFVLKNTVNELYYLDSSYLGNFKVNDDVLLLYLDRKLLENGGYSANVYAIYPAAYELSYPRN